MMTPRERVLAAINFRKPDRIPLAFYVCEDNLARHGQAVLDLLRRYPSSDFGDPPTTVPQADPQYVKDGVYHKAYTDEWGCTWDEHLFGHVGQIIRHPLADWAAYKDYAFPPVPPTDPNHPELLCERAKTEEQKKRRYVKKLFVRTFEQMHFVRGFARVCEDLALGRPELADLADRVTEWNRAWVRWAVAAGADGVTHSDDWGTQNAMIISPKLWREFFKPRYAREFEPAREAGVDIWFHSDGVILPILEDMAELGVKVVNPQFSCHDLKTLAASTRKAGLAVATDLDRQFIMPHGTPQQVREYVREIIETFDGRSGGLIGQCEVRGPIPLANIEAALAAFQEFGTN